MDTDDKAEEFGLKSGDVIAGKYRVEREIGRGGMGVVVAATHVDLDQRVAIKVLQKSAAFNQDALIRFLREARSAAKIRSEHVARVMDVGKLEDGMTYIVMEYLEGADLSDVLRKEGPLRITTAAEYILQACEGIAAAHAAGIIHRDIKPANVFLARQPGRSNSIKILDFGVSKVSKKSSDKDDKDKDKHISATQAGQVFGSPMYMSPEQLDSTVPIDCRTDIWALGVVLFELIAGKPPFNGKSLANIMTAVIRDPAPKLRTLRPDVPAALEEVVARCLEKERDLRYATVIDLAEAIAPFCGKGADDAVNRIYQILAHAQSEETESNLGPSSSREANVLSKEESTGRQSDRRRSGPRHDSAESALQGASHTQPGPQTNSTRRALALGMGLAATAAVFGAIIYQRNTQPTLGSLSISTSAALDAAPASMPVSAAPSINGPEVKSPLSPEVTITFTGAPNDTKVFRGDVELGSAATPLHLPRSSERITLRFVADTFAPTEVELLPNVDQTLAITLKPEKPTATPPTKRKVPKELEPF